MPTSSAAADDAKAIAAEVFNAMSRRIQISPFSQRLEGFNLSTAYEAAAELSTMRAETLLGRKIGFTNRALWERYGVDAPIWGHMTTQSVSELTDATVSLDPFLEPRLEPEIAVKLRSTPDPAMSDAALIEAIEWVAPAFEIVQSVYPGWKFQLADGAAAGGLHGALLLGAPVRSGPWASALGAITVHLSCNGKPVESGVGANALGGPLEALRHLMKTLLADAAAPLRAGEIVTTGTLTDAQPIVPGQDWTAAFGEGPLSDIRARFA